MRHRENYGAQAVVVEEEMGGGRYSQSFVISLLGNQWVPSIGLPVVNLRRI